MMSSAFTAWLSCYCILLLPCLLQITLENLSFLSCLHWRFTFLTVRKLKKTRNFRLPFIFVDCWPRCAVCWLQPLKCSPAGCWAGPAGLERLLRSRGSGQSQHRALPFLCLTSDLGKQELIKTSEGAKRKGKCLVTN